MEAFGHDSVVVEIHSQESHRARNDFIRLYKRLPFTCGVSLLKESFITETPGLCVGVRRLDARLAPRRPSAKQRPARFRRLER